jgi:dephospho-CoA kinase
MMILRIIGITGGIGSGKSTISKILRDLGAVIVDADAIARTVTGNGGKAFKELVSYFGSDILDSNGEMDRKKLGYMAFNDQVKLHALNTITHKYIIEKIRDSIDILKASGKADVVVVDVPVPVEHGFLDIVDEVWVVSADVDVRMKRIMERNGFTSEEALNRINAQISDDEYINVADEVIYNNGDIEDLEKAAVKLFFKKKDEGRGKGTLLNREKPSGA